MVYSSTVSHAAESKIRKQITVATLPIFLQCLILCCFLQRFNLFPKLFIFCGPVYILLNLVPICSIYFNIKADIILVIKNHLKFKHS